MDLRKLLEVGRWFDPFPEPPSQIYLFAVGVFVLWTIAAMVLYFFRRRLFVGRGALIGMVTRFGWYAIVIGWTGLFLLLMRYGGVPYLDIRFLLYVTILAAVAFVVFVGYYL